MIREKQEAPNQIELEFVYGCNMGCSFCGLMGVMGGFTNPRFIAPATLHEIVSKIAQAGWKSKIIISGHGEPMLHPSVIALVQMIKSTLPKNHLSMITNGTNLTQETVIALFKAGLDNLAVDEYTKSDNADKVRQFIFNIPGLAVSDYRQKTECNVRDRLMGKSRSVSILEPIDLATDKTRKLVNRCGSAFPKNMSKANSRCTKPFREMVFDYDGNLLLCCNDFRRECLTGNIFDYDSIDHLWNNRVIEMYRKMLYNGSRGMFPCHGCDAPSYRVGLLPDKFGKQEMPQWTENDQAIFDCMVKRTDDTREREYEKEET